ncbi:hypothetical protein UFOVP96_10 [uncultured Caudovirales phage]|uniref:Uncharacterized protein n=1 Tax=uncultured Caudovirales phage TaxID=2100421 RepID=A0A6J5L7G5_9CAUD|nr:hypothetical protein UFOVP96_10 [uncultured Caudovirales phage]
MADNGIYGVNQANPYPQTEFLDEKSKRPTRAWQQFFLNLLNYSSSSTATGGTATLPDSPAGFINMVVGGRNVKVPYYNE